MAAPHRGPVAGHPRRPALRQHLLAAAPGVGRARRSSKHIQAILIEELDELGKLDLGELLADATFIRAKKGATRSAKPRLARA